MADARAVALRALVALERGETQRLRDALGTHALPPRDQAFAFELAHGVLRRERLLDHVLLGLAHRGLPEDPRLVAALRLGAYQLTFVPGMPTHAAVHATVQIVRSNKGFANAVLRGIARAIEERPAADERRDLVIGPDRVLRLARPLPDDEALRLAVVHSLPDFLVERWVTAFGIEAARGIAAAASAIPGVFLRVAAARDPAALTADLTAAGVEVTTTAHERMLRWSGGSSPFATAAFRDGAFVVQDPTAAAAAAALPCRPGDVVVDLCAAPGTKTTALAERVRPGGRVFAFDVDAARRQRIVENVARLRLGEVVQIVDDASTLPRADAVLADVPCSNSGVLARRVEVRRRLQPTTFAEMASLQRRLLAQALRLCKPGGVVLYSTCSIDPEENDAVVDGLLADGTMPRATALRRCLTLPKAGECDGGWFALLRREA
jgi:16S rRNA (cytosine967-C5)-methyltransferase